MHRSPLLSPLFLNCLMSMLVLSATRTVFAQSPAGQVASVAVTTANPDSREDESTRRGRAILERAMRENSQHQSIYEDAIILTYDGMHTVVPVGSILHLPIALRDRISPEPVGRLVLWPAFLQLNSSWIKLQNLPAAVVKGIQPVPPKIERDIAFDPKLVVATYLDNPVTVWEYEKGSSSRSSN